MTPRPPADDEVRQLLVHPAVWPDLVQWLDRRGINVGQMPTGDEDLPTYRMVPSDALLAAAQADPSSVTDMR